MARSVAGSGNASRSLERNAELQLKLDKASYAPGEEIELSLRAPYAGAGAVTVIAAPSCLPHAVGCSERAEMSISLSSRW